VTTLEPTNDSPTGHTPHTVVVDEGDRCPWCGQPIDRSEYNRIKREIEAGERGRLEKAEKTLKERFERQAKSQAEKARLEATRAAEEQVKALMANQKKIVTQRLQAQRTTLEKAKSAAVNTEKEKFFREKLKLEEQLHEMQRRLQKKSTNELGSEGEVNGQPLRRSETRVS
jgi:CRISPR/Cas system-associated protein Cas10 (large subunit of type III CRISPR-Cas system)